MLLSNTPHNLWIDDLSKLCTGNRFSPFITKSLSFKKSIIIPIIHGLSGTLKKGLFLII